MATSARLCDVKHAVYRILTPMPSPIVYQPRRACAWCGALSCDCAQDFSRAFRWQDTDLLDLLGVSDLDEEGQRLALAAHGPYPQDDG